MADSANRLYYVFRAKPKDTSSKLVGFTVTSLNPMTLTDGDKLKLPRDFFIFNNMIDTSKISIGDKFLAITVNDKQLYYIQDVISSTNRLYRQEKEIDDLEDEVTSLKSRCSSLEARVTALEQRIYGGV